jgi:hypothetical protein
MQPQAFFSDETWPCERANTDLKGKRVLKKINLNKLIISNK